MYMMGVRGLFSYIEKQCPEALQDVNLRRLSDEYRRKYNTRPVLLLDCNNFIAAIYGNLEFALGGQWMQHLENLKTFQAAFHDAGFELVIMFDGVIEKKKMKIWIDRRKKERKLVNRIFRDIKSNGKHPAHNLFHIPPGLSSFTRLALKSVGASVHSSTVELDRECYLYCKKHSCYGVVSRDTDLMIYDIPEVLLVTYAGRRMKRVQRYRKESLCRHLGLHPKALPLFACLVGCDTVPHHMLSGFHHRVTRGRRDPLIPCVAGFIRSLQLRDLSRESVDWVASQVHGSLGNGFLYECVQEYACDAEPQWQSGAPSRSLSMPVASNGASQDRASPASISHNIEPSALEKIKRYSRDSAISSFVLHCVTVRQYCSNMSLEDDGDESMPSSALLYRPVRQRMYGFLLGSPAKSSCAGAADAPSHHRPEFGSVEEICAYSGNPLNTPDVVLGMPLDLATQPRVEDLWLDSEEAPALCRRVFFSCLSATPLLESGLLDAVPHHYVPLCCILRYLLAEGPASAVRSCDVDAFLSQAVCLPDHSPDTLEKLRVPAVSARGVHLATIFMRGLSTVCEVNSACCLPFKMDTLLPWRSFDGKLFHIKYLAVESGQSAAQLCDGRVEALKSFHEMRRRVVMGTRLEEYSPDPLNVSA